MANIVPIPEINVQDFILEALSFVAYLFILLAAFYAKKKNKIFASKGFPILILAIALGIIAAFMNVFTELFWIEKNYEQYKLAMSVIQIAGLFLFAFSLMLVFKFTKYLMGDDV